MMSCELNKLKIDKNKLKSMEENMNRRGIRGAQVMNDNKDQIKYNIMNKKDDEIKVYRRSTDAIKKEQIRSLQELTRDVHVSYREFNESFIKEGIKQTFPRMDQPEPPIPKEFTLLDLRLRAVLAELRASNREHHNLYGSVAKIRMVACVRTGSLLLLPSIFADSHKTDKECATLVIGAALCEELLAEDSKCRIGGRRGCSVNAAIKDCLESGKPGAAFWDAVSAVECFLSYDRMGLGKQINKYDSVIRELMEEMDRRLGEDLHRCNEDKNTENSRDKE